MVDPEPEGATPLAVSTTFGTISEYFFLTMRLMHTGVLSSFAVTPGALQAPAQSPSSRFRGDLS